MIILKNGDPAVLKAWGTQKPKDGPYRKLRYLLETPCKDGRLLLNTVTGEAALLDHEEARAFDALPGTPETILGEALSRHYIVPAAFDEKKAVGTLRQILKMAVRERGTKYYTILPTTACNARCFYCYESDYPHLTMDEETAERLAQYILEHLCKGRKVHITWFGGEPLVGARAIRRLSKRLQEESMDFTSVMVSNGYLFTPELAREARKDWHLKKVQITLDGTEEIYNRTKAYVSADESPYHRVLGNIGQLLGEGITVNVRINLDVHNDTDLERLIDELADRFGGSEHFFCYVHELFDSAGFTPVTHSPKEWNAMRDRRVALVDHIEAAGLHLPPKVKRLASLKESYCIADNSSSVTVTPQGRLGKCEHFAYSHLVGNLTDGVTDKCELNAWLRPKFSPVCGACPLFPYCGIPSVCPTEKPCNPAQSGQRIEQQLRLLRELCK